MVSINISKKVLIAATNIFPDEIPEDIEKIWVFYSTPNGKIIHHSNPHFFESNCIGRDVRIIFFCANGSNIAIDSSIIDSWPYKYQYDHNYNLVIVN